MGVVLTRQSEEIRSLRRSVGDDHSMWNDSSHTSDLLDSLKCCSLAAPD